MSGAKELYDISITDQPLLRHRDFASWRGDMGAADRRLTFAPGITI
jgi:hypothetical protein